MAVWPQAQICAVLGPSSRRRRERGPSDRGFGECHLLRGQGQMHTNFEAMPTKKASLITQRCGTNCTSISCSATVGVPVGCQISVRASEASLQVFKIELLSSFRAGSGRNWVLVGLTSGSLPLLPPPATDAASVCARLQRVQDQMHTNFEAMPTNDGKLVHTAVRYALHKYFVQRHGWSVRGLSDLG